MTNNSLSEDIYAVGQLMADNLNSVGVSDADVDDGLTTLAGKILNASGGKTPTILTLNTPMVVYTDLFTVTGTLTDDEDNPIEGATIQLIWDDGTEHIATGVTNSSGVFSFTSTDSASVSAYSFQLFFAGDNDYNASNSSVVNVNTSKETSVLVVTSPASGAVVSTDSVAVTGTLKDNDGTAMSGKSVSFSLNNVSAGTATVGSDGSFSKTVTGLIAGSNSITVSFAATTTHTAANQSITVNRSTFDGLSDLSLIAGSQILSYADEQQTPGSQYATLETQLMNGDSPATIEGVEVGFWDFTDESAPYFLTSDVTDSNGKASFTYPSRGVGDVPIKAVVGSILTKTYEVEDCTRVNPLTSNDNLWSNNSATISYSNDGMYISNGNWSQFYLLDTLPQGSILEFDITQVNVVSNTCLSSFLSVDTGTQTHSTQKDMIATGHYKAVIENNVLTWYKDNTLLSTETWTNANSYWFIWTGGARTVTLKNLKLKPL